MSLLCLLPVIFLWHSVALPACLCELSPQSVHWPFSPRPCKPPAAAPTVAALLRVPPNCLHPPLPPHPQFRPGPIFWCMLPSESRVPCVRAQSPRPQSLAGPFSLTVSEPGPNPKTRVSGCVPIHPPATSSPRAGKGVRGSEIRTRTIVHPPSSTPTGSPEPGTKRRGRAEWGCQRALNWKESRWQRALSDWC